MQNNGTAPNDAPENATSTSQSADGGSNEHDPAFDFMDDEDERDDDGCEREPRYSVSSVAWAIASLGHPDGPDLLPDAWRICELVDEGTFGEWLKGMIEESPDYESPEYAPDSIEASEAASGSAQDQMNATSTMKTLTKRQQWMLQAQVDSVLPSDISFEVGQLMPFESAYDDETESGDTSTSDDGAPHCELWDQSFPEKIRFLTKLQHDLRTKRDEALNELDFEDYSKLTNEMEGLRDKQIELLVAEIAALRSPASAPVSIDEPPIPSEKEPQQQLRKKFSMIFAEIWTSSPKIIRESAQMEIDLTLKTDRAVNHTISKMGYLPKFPTQKKAAMEREAMDILEAFRISPKEEEIPTIKEAKANLYEYLMSMAETLLMDMDPAAGERD